jgi:D-alanine-D-alanine ligase
MTVAILDGHAFPVVEICPENELYDYESKYTTGKSEYIAPAKIPIDLSRHIRNAAVSVYEVIGASGIARVDFILADSEEFYCLELNSLPGMTDLSLVPMAARCEGIEFDQLIDKMIQSALK